MAALFGAGHPVTAVGDPDQNIYAWRGASLYNLFRFPQEFPKADGTPATQLPLYTNFRSGARILAAADAVIGARARGAAAAGQAARPVRAPTGRARCASCGCSTSGPRRGGSPTGASQLHAAGSVWSEMAVLCRTSRLFTLLRQAFDEREVPVEIVGLAGLLRMPEVVEVLAYARAVQDPTASVALARILLGPRYRVGFKDIALLARLATEKTKSLRDDYELEDDDIESQPVLLAEALEHLEDVEALSEEGRERLAGFREELRALRVEARRPVGEFLGEVIRRIGILDELDADPDRRRGLGARRNLAAFLDEVHAFQPVDGELTLRVFLDHIDAVERLDKQEWAPVQPSDADSVKVMTIHVAKGLEFDHVFVPGFAHELLPNPKVPQNPAERGKSLDFELRGDADILPRYDGQPVGVPRRAEGAGDHRGAPDRLRRAHPRAQDARCQRRLLVRRQHLPQEGKPVPERADGLGRRQRARGGRGRRDRAGRGEPDARAARAVRARLAGPGAPAGGRSAVPERLAPGGARPRGADRSDRAARAGGARLLRSAGRRPGPARRPTCASARPPRGSAPVDGDRIPRTLSASSLDGSRALPEAVLLDARAAAAPLQRTGGAHRHRDPPVDRAPRLGPGSAARGRRRRRPHPGGARRRSRAGWTGCGRRSSHRGTPTGRRCSPSARSCCGSAGSR